MSDQRICKMWETKMNWMTGKIFCFHILFVAMKVAEGNPRPLPARSGSPVCKVRVIIKACFIIYGIWHKLTCNLSKWFTTGDDGLSSNMTIGVGISHFFEGQWTQPFGIVGGTFSDNLSRNSYIQSCTIGVWTGIHYIHYITANILQCHHWFPRKMTSENRVQKFHTVSTQIWVVLWLVENLLHPVRNTTQIWVMLCHQYGIPAFVSETFLLGNQYRCHKMFWLA